MYMCAKVANKWMSMYKVYGNIEVHPRRFIQSWFNYLQLLHEHRPVCTRFVCEVIIVGLNEAYYKFRYVWKSARKESLWGTFHHIGSDGISDMSRLMLLE